MQRPIIFYAAHLVSQNNSAAAVRLKLLIGQLRAEGLKVEVWSNGPTSGVRDGADILLSSPLPSNTRGFLRRFFGEVIAGLEISWRLSARRLRCFVQQTERPLVILSSPPYITCL